MQELVLEEGKVIKLTTSTSREEVSIEKINAEIATLSNAANNIADQIAELEELKTRINQLLE